MSKVLEIGLACSPAHFIGKGVVKNMKRVLISYGGGMGGSNRTYYTEKVNKEQAVNGTWNIVDIDGNKRELNPRFIVEIVETKVLILKTDTTEHVNYHEKTCDKKTLTEFFDLGELGYTDYVLKSHYNRTSDKIKPFKIETETF